MTDTTASPPAPPAPVEPAEPTYWQVVDEAKPRRRKAADAGPGPDDDLQSIAKRCRKRVTQRAALAAGVAVVPIPGLDWAADVGLLMRLLPQINAEFGLSPEQIERLAPDRRIVVFKAISAGGGLLVGKLITRELVLHMVKLVGVRLTAQQAAKFVPLAGQAVSALLTFTAMRFVCEQHIQQCMTVARQVQLLGAE
jgi:uncharacterized protein (DUF697 family)